MNSKATSISLGVSRLAISPSCSNCASLIFEIVRNSPGSIVEQPFSFDAAIGKWSHTLTSSESRGSSGDANDRTGAA